MTGFLAAFAATWLIVAPAEIGDKTFWTAVAMGGSKRWRKSAVAVGAALAFILTMAIAVGLGGVVLSLLPPIIKYPVMAALFFYFAYGALQDVLDGEEDGDEDQVDTDGAKRGFRLQVGQSAAMFFAAEWLDKSQFAAATAAGTAAGVTGFLGVFAGAWAGITSVVLLGLVGGVTLGKIVPPRVMSALAMLAFAGFGSWAAWMFFQSL